MPSSGSLVYYKRASPKKLIHKEFNSKGAVGGSEGEGRCRLGGRRGEGSREGGGWGEEGGRDLA